MTVIGLTAALALLPMPREVEWREGTCTFAEADAVFVRDAALPPEGIRWGRDPVCCGGFERDSGGFGEIAAPVGVKTK